MTIRGRYNSSLTRVRPFFQQLLSRDPSGEWLGQLIDSAPRGERLRKLLPGHPAGLLAELVQRRRYQDPVAGPVELEKAFEHRVAPPVAFLRYLLESPERLTWPVARGVRQVFGEETQRLREALVDGVGEVRSAARTQGRNELEARGPAGSGQQWWAFEGFTHVDCYLETTEFVLFLEGKRTELLSESTAWFAGRNQLVRNLEALGDEAGGRPCGLLLVTEEPMEEPTDLAYETGLPHLSPAERSEVGRRYLGQTTWQALCANLNVPFASLPGERQQ